ncbi:zinc ribbon domain-containing protein [Celeribacter marinus]|uniref:zinc ribbon domain-containing protein n=1 Tax=Celeribacter marinus TaxID=1397108 RepID=UPI00317686E9
MIQCQSCGLAMRKDPMGGGTEADGTKSTSFCSNCYNNGAFTAYFGTAKEMQAFCKTQMRKSGVLNPIAWIFTQQIPFLDRWRED